MAMCLFASRTSPLAVETPHPITPQVAGSCLRDDHPPFCLNTRILSVMRQDSRVRDDLGDREMPTSFGFRHKHVAQYLEVFFKHTLIHRFRRTRRLRALEANGKNASTF